MKRSLNFSIFAVAIAFSLLLLQSNLVAQDRENRNGRERGGDANDSERLLKTVGLKLGDKLPDVAGYDIDGKPFSLRNINGSHAVIVFGCMT